MKGGTSATIRSGRSGESCLSKDQMETPLMCSTEVNQTLVCCEIRKFGEFWIETGSRLREGSGKSWSRTGLGSGIELGPRLEPD